MSSFLNDALETLSFTGTSGTKSFQTTAYPQSVIETALWRFSMNIV